MLKLRPVLIFLLALGATASAHAGYRGPDAGPVVGNLAGDVVGYVASDVVDNIVLADGGISLNQAISMVERRFRARVVRSDVRQEGERRIYVLRLLDDAGNAQVVRVDASSGAIL